MYASALALSISVDRVGRRVIAGAGIAGAFVAGQLF
jgi:hypothetical protein